MPRQVHGQPVTGTRSSAPAKRKLMKDQYYNALEVAEKQNPIKTKIRQHRLGDVEEVDGSGSQSRVDLDGRSSKRRKVSIEADGDDELVEGSDSDGNQWHVGVDVDDEDSDIDSDEAFGESDEDRFADYTFRGSATDHSRESKKTAQREKSSWRQGVNLLQRDDDFDLGEESSDEEEKDDLGEDAIDLATALDMNNEEEQREKDRATRASQKTSQDFTQISEEENSGSEEEDSDISDGEDEDSELALSGEEDEGGHSKLRSFMDKLQQSGSAKETSTSTILKSVVSSSKLSAADLLQYVKDPRQRQSLKVLANGEETTPQKHRGGIPGKLEPPLAKRQQDRLDRVAAYDKSKETLNRWIESVKQNRRAEHISFPLQDPKDLFLSSATNLAPTSQSQPLTPLETAIKEIMQESGLLSKNGPSVDEQERAFEELQQKRMPAEEVQARRMELRMARELMFREEIRARRIKKIKSKAYRRVHRKERDKAALEEKAYLAAAGLVHSDEERKRNDRRRAEERMGARHRESKWAKSVKATGRASWDEDARHGVSDLARRDEELRRRIEGKTVRRSDQSDQDSTSNSEGELSSGDEEGFDEFNEKIEQLDRPPVQQDTTRLGSMAFMQRAEAVRKAANDNEVRSLRRTLHGDVGEDDDGEAESTGRLHFGKEMQLQDPISRPLNDKSEFEEKLSEDDEVRQDHRVASSGTASRMAGPNASSTVKKPRKHQQLSVVPVKSGKAIPKSTVIADAKSNATSKRQPNRVSGTTQTLEDLSSDSGSDSGVGIDLNDNAALAKALFAGDDVVAQEFEREKKQTIEEEGDQEIDNTLPGWGSWAGVGISKREQKRSRGRFVTTIKGVAEDQRKDARLDRVIINEKQVKKNGKYLSSELPHPFESRQQYERSLRLPIGPEWTTKSTFQDATKPRVLMKQGIIRPMSRPIA